MGSAPAVSTAALHEQLMSQREIARTSLCFFDNVAPLAHRIGMADFPEFTTFSSRFSETEDINTNQLRADGSILQRVHVTAAAQVAYQHEQDAPLVDCWPDGAGTVAHGRLRAHLPRADADLTQLGELATGLLVAADCIDIARFAKFSAIGTIDATSLLGMPISGWGSIVESLGTAPVEELRAAITAAVNLFVSAANTCDQAVDAILAGVCTALQGMNAAEYPTGQQSVCDPAPATPDPTAPAPAGLEAHGASERDCDESVPTTSAESSGTSSAQGGGSTGSGSQASAVPVAPVADVRAASSTTSATGSTTAHVTAAPVSTGGGAESTGLLAPLAAAVSQVITGAVAGLVEAVVSARVEGQGVPMAAGEPDAAPVARPEQATAVPLGDVAAVALGEKTVEVKLGDDGRSLSLTVRESGAAPDTGAGGDAAPPENRPADCPDVAMGPAHPDVAESALADGPNEGTAGDESWGQQPAEPPPASDAENCPVPTALPGPASVPNPHPARLPDQGPTTQVAPQATDSGPGSGSAPGDEGVLALAGDQ